ncbi:spore germination protein GerPE [Anaerobacillus sp. MEB173]|uniref:spore germination protein GerPE n=1 Tax=Anaerobacillus sp. MEB173 TaxID=3383345 RepID=UPI003F91C252
MTKRISNVKNIKIIDLSFSSIFQVGDSVQLTPHSNALAVQRTISEFYGNEGNLQHFPLFTRNIPIPIIDERLSIQRRNECSFINVNNVKIITTSGSSVVHIGSTKKIDAEARVKHIRQLVDDTRTQ